MDVSKTINKLRIWWFPFILSMNVNKTVNKLSMWFPFILSTDAKKTNPKQTKDKISLYSLNGIWFGFHSCKGFRIHHTYFWVFFWCIAIVLYWSLDTKYLQWVLLNIHTWNIEKFVFLFKQKEPFETLCETLCVLGMWLNGYVEKHWMVKEGGRDIKEDGLYLQQQVLTEN